MRSLPTLPVTNRFFSPRKIVRAIAVVVCVAPWFPAVHAEAVDSTDEEPDTVFLNLDEKALLFDDPAAHVQPRNPIRAGVLSLVFPGLGQVYCGEYVRGGAFLAAEATMAGMVASRALTVRAYDHYTDSLAEETAMSDVRYRATLESARLDTTIDTTIAQRVWARDRGSFDLWEYDARQVRHSLYHSIGWLASAHLFNVLNALHVTRFAHSSGPRSPVRAGLLSAVPALALGQYYNGELSKAGMILMVQGMLGYMAYNNHSQMGACIDGRNSTVSALDPDVYRGWTNRYNEAARQRNMYLWYSLFYYCYGIFDAVVDAHLHDYPDRMRFDATYDPATASVGVMARINF